MPQIIFLDQNKWIDLFRSANSGIYHSLVGNLQNAVANGKVILPISDQHIIECQKIADKSHREALAAFIVNLSNGWVYAQNFYLEKKEFEYSIMPHFGITNIPKPIAVGRGIPYACGYDMETFQQLIGKPLKFCKLLLAELEKPELLIQQLSGSDNSASLEFMKSMKSVVSDEEVLRNMSKKFSKKQQQNTYVGKYVMERVEMIDTIMKKWSYTVDNFIDLGKTGMEEIIESAPSVKTYIELTLDTYRNTTRPLNPNDFIDFSSLMVAIPYSDIVVCENYMASVAIQRKLDKRYGTIITSKLNDLPKYMDS